MELNIKFNEKTFVEAANRVLDEFEYKGKTIREWADLITNPKTNGDRIRAMTDEELAEYLDGVCHDLWQMFVKDPQKMWLDWLKEEAKDD
jgi:hypothetical protein